MLTRGFPRTCSAALLVLCAVCGFGVVAADAQGLGGAGTVQGTVKDPIGGVMQAVTVQIGNPVSGFTRSTTTDASGRY
ncbi:MAG TPA: carboxypeptidase-like regulatory domain-containing protein [Vicinamibacterales bacterium]